MNKNLIWFDHPAREWVDGLPIGNGRIGTLVPGYAARELLCLNHEGIWHATEAADRTTVPVAQWLPEIRKLALAGKWKQADDLLVTKLQPTNRIVKAMAEHQPAGNLSIFFPCRQPAEDYQRSLDLATGVARVTYRIGDINYERRYFVSAVHDLLVIEIEGNAAGSVSCNPFLETLAEMHQTHPHLRAQVPDCAYRHDAAGDTIGFTAHYTKGMNYAVALRAVINAGRMGLDKNGGLLIENANKATLLVSITTSEQAPDPRALCQQRLTQVDDVAKLAPASVQEHRAFFDRVAFTLGEPTEDKPTDELLHAAYRGRSPHHLFELMLQMGRYLMLASSRPGTKAITLQGIWNKDIHPAWENDWHLDLNVQMSYWIAEVGNLGECVAPLFAMIESLVPDGEKNARDIYGCGGVFFPVCFAGRGVVMGGHAVSNTCVAGWLAQHLWWHYEYTQDRTFLRQRAYPFLKKVAAFYQDFLFKNNQGQYAILPSASPEHPPANRAGLGTDLNATMDIAVIYELMTHLLTASETLAVDAELQPVWREIKDHLPAWPLEPDGALKEWADDSAAPDDFHRHLSHLYPAFPGDIFTPETTPALMKAASKALARRQSVLDRGLQVDTKLPYPQQRISGMECGVGWGFPNMAIIHARLLEGDKALECLNYLARGFLAESLLSYSVDWRAQGFTDYPPACAEYSYPWLFQIEAILGASAAIAEMLLQSHQGLVRILPALPAEWSTGSVRGLRARNGFEVAIAWENNTPTKIEIKSLLGNTCRMKLYAPCKSVEVCCHHQPIDVDHHPEGSFSFPTEKDRTYTISVHSAGRGPS